MVVRLCKSARSAETIVTLATTHCRVCWTPLASPSRHARAAAELRATATATVAAGSARDLALSAPESLTSEVTWLPDYGTVSTETGEARDAELEPEPESEDTGTLTSTEPTSVVGAITSDFIATRPYTTRRDPSDTVKVAHHGCWRKSTVSAGSTYVPDDDDSPQRTGTRRLKKWKFKTNRWWSSDHLHQLAWNNWKVGSNFLQSQFQLNWHSCCLSWD